ncbi:hypothetical protein [Methyloligella solikamskensis]|uniref:Uncharacterized protein n=1 Tax=Methyloligella solikamskensis TaxID=1177756 RepID=A0ABW3J8E1_9HYPH
MTKWKNRSQSTIRWAGRACLGLGLAAGFVSLEAVPAEAKIRCQGIYMQTKNGPIVTPYCSEKEIARVARSYGEKVTDAQVHNDALTKVRLCQRFGNDNRLKGACGAYNLRNYR